MFTIETENINTFKYYLEHYQIDRIDNKYKDSPLASNLTISDLHAIFDFKSLPDSSFRYKDIYSNYVFIEEI